jgi:murein DD-endopeptidase MepM/ murein hydrolase activator NlpD
MNSKFRLSSGKLSVILAATVAAMLIITVSVLTVALAMSMKDGGKKPVPPIDENIGDNGENENQTPDDDAGSEGENGDGQQTIVPVPDLPKWTSPVEGYVFKQHSTDALVYSLTLGDYRVHKGIDISAPTGSVVKACLDGTIENVYYDPMMGHCVTVSHRDGMLSHYKNLGEELPTSVVEGQKVKSGEVIGYVGESAIVEFSDEPHLHFELETNGKSENPLDYLEYSETPSEIEND